MTFARILFAMSLKHYSQMLKYINNNKTSRNVTITIKLAYINFIVIVVLCFHATWISCHRYLMNMTTNNTITTTTTNSIYYCLNSICYIFFTLHGKDCHKFNINICGEYYINMTTIHLKITVAIADIHAAGNKNIVES